MEDEPHADGKFIGPSLVCGNPTVEPGEGCDDGNAINGDGFSANCLAEHDTVLKAPKPLSMKIAAGSGSATKTIKVTVVNADIAPTPESPGHAVEIAASSDCPYLTVNSIDYGGGSSSASILGGESATVRVSLMALSSATTFNKKAANRCRVTLTASTSPGFGKVETTPDNIVATLDVNIIDKNDPETTPANVHGTFLASLKPLTVKIGAGKSNASKALKCKASNADYLPSGEAAALHPISVATGGTCPAMTIGSATVSGAPSVDVEGGKKAGGAATVTAASADFSAPNPLSPARWRATLTANGPAGDSDAANNTTEVVIDVLDENDF